MATFESTQARLRLAAALAYHLPAAAVTLNMGIQIRVVASTTFRDAELHPADFRELVAAAEYTGSHKDLCQALAVVSLSDLRLAVIPAPPILEDLGGDVYMIAVPNGKQVLAFASLMTPRDVAAAIRDAECEPATSVSGVLVYDDALAVTLATFAVDPNLRLSATIDSVRGAYAAAAVAETLASAQLLA